MRVGRPKLPGMPLPQRRLPLHASRQGRPAHRWAAAPEAVLRCFVHEPVAVRGFGSPADIFNENGRKSFICNPF